MESSAATARDQAEIRAGLERVIHPVSPVGGGERVLFTHGSGLRLWDADGEEWLDAVSGLWNVAAGYGRAELVAAAQPAIERFGFASLYFSHGHEFAARLATELARLTQPGIERFFFTSEGSTAVDTAIRLVRYEAALRGRPEKVKIVARWQSYHGSSLGSATVTGQRAFWDHFGPQAPGICHVPQPSREDPNSIDELEAAIIREGPDTVAAFIAEPVSVPSGVLVPGDDYWPRVRELCDRYDIRLIADEVVTGFGRTGRLFALEHWGVVPDLVVLSKGLTSGYAPLAAVGITDEVYAAITDERRPFMHGFTTSGHPLSASIALANLEILEREGLVENARVVGEHLRATLEEVASQHDGLGEVRVIGMLAGIDVLPTDAAAESPLAPPVMEAARSRRMMIRAYDDALVIAPSLVANVEDVDEIGRRLNDALEDLGR